MRGRSGTLTVRNQAQKILWEEELNGQISDGMWENATPHDHWDVWSDAEITVGKNVGRTFFARKCNYNFTNPELLNIVGDRMIKAVQVEIPEYTKADLIADLKDLKQIVHTERAATPADTARKEAILAEENQRKMDVQRRYKDNAENVKSLAADLGVDIGYVGTSYVKSSDGISYAMVLELVEAAVKAVA